MKKKFSRVYLLLFSMAALPAVGCATYKINNSTAEGMAVSSLISLGICFAVVGGLIGIFFFVIWIIALVDCAKRKPDEFPAGAGGENAKILWLVILIATFFVTQLNGVAAIVYYFLVMKKMPRKQ